MSNVQYLFADGLEGNMICITIEDPELQEAVFIPKMWYRNSSYADRSRQKVR